MPGIQAGAGLVCKIRAVVRVWRLLVETLVIGRAASMHPCGQAWPGAGCWRCSCHMMRAHWL